MEYLRRRNDLFDLGERIDKMVDIRTLDITKEEEDAAGPMLDLFPLYNMFLETSGDQGGTLLPKGKLANLDMYPRDHLVTLALASGLYQTFPDSLSGPVTRVTPSVLIRHIVRRRAQEVATDDALLLEEAYDENGCEALTEEELLEACFVRGLPVTVPPVEMRRCLTNHLKMIRALKQRLPNGTPTEAFELFTLHLPAIRHYLRLEAEMS